MKIQGIVTVFLLTCLVGAGSGCSTSNALKEAQQAFNTAAQLENQQKLNTLSGRAIQSGLPALESTAISAAYSAVIDSLAKADEGSLQKMGLLSNAYALRAMSYWRLQKYALAKDYQQRALQQHQQQNNALGDRDYVMMNILPSLIDNDKTRQKILVLRGRTASDKDINPLLNTLSESMKNLDSASRSLPADHPLHTYLLASKLGAFSNYKDACLLLSRKKLADRLKVQKQCIQAPLCQAKKSYTALPQALQPSFKQLFIGYQCPAPQ